MNQNSGARGMLVPSWNVDLRERSLLQRKVYSNTKGTEEFNIFDWDQSKSELPVNAFTLGKIIFSLDSF